VLAALALVAIAFAPTIGWLFEEYTHTQWRNVHGIFVPLFVFLLARSALRRDPEPSRPEASAWGFVPLIAGLGLAVLDAGVRSRYLAAVGLVLCIPGLSLLFLGARRTRLLAAPLALCAFALPVPEGLADPFRINAVTSWLAGEIVDASGLAVIRHHTAFLTRNGSVNVSQNCSGLAALYAAFALSFVLAYSARSWRRRIWIPLLVFPLTGLANAVRIAGIVVLTDRVGTHFLRTSLHGLSGLLMLWFVIGCLWLCSDHRGLRESLS
jgi:exosortase